MIFYLVLAGILILAGVWFFQVVQANPNMLTTIQWLGWEYELKTATLVLVVAFVCLGFYATVSLLKYLVRWRKNLSRYKESRLTSKASRALNQGLLQLTEGYFEKAEKTLIEHAPYSENAVLNYLAAARSAHMQTAYDRRDEYLRLAIERDPSANIAVGVSQADMQFSSNQLEQAHATLSRLHELAPKHPYILKLFARVLYRQESWEALLEMLPDLLKNNLFKTEDLEKVQKATLQAMFQKYAKQKDLDKLQTLWKKLPSVIRENPNAIWLYANALNKAGDDILTANLVSAQLNKQWNDELADLYGNIRHHSLANAIQQAEKWLATQPNNPVMQLLMARLYNQQKLWGMAKNYYEASLNQAPHGRAYLELAELLETMKEPENAQRCYRLGLRFSMRQETERLTLLPTQRPLNQQTPVLTPYNGL